MERLSSAFVAALVPTGTAMLLLLQDKASLSEITGPQWMTVAIGMVIAMAKDLHSYDTTPKE